VLGPLFLTASETVLDLRWDSLDIILGIVSSPRLVHPNLEIAACYRQLRLKAL